MKSLPTKKKHFLRRAYDKMHLFTDKEAWGLYRFAAFVEAGFWVFCIATFIYGAAGLPLAESVVAYGRSILGTAYGVYAIFVILIARSLEWRIGKVLLALIAGALPLGSIVFERLMGRHRKLHPKYIAPPASYEE